MEYRTIGIIGAMEEEVEKFQSFMQNAKTTVKAGIRFSEGDWEGRRVIVCRCGVGKVNAAVCTQILIDTFGAEAIVFTGVAGALNPELEIGDIVISVDCLQHDMDASPLGYAPGEIPFAAESTFAADRELIASALKAGEALFPGKVRLGRVLSGDQFLADREKVAALRERHGGDCVEMEGAAVAQVCRLNVIPFVILRSMSDKADGSAHMNFKEFTQLASERSAAIVEQMLRR